MDTKDTAEKTEPFVAPAKPAPVPELAGEPGSEEPVPSVPLSGLVDDSLDGLGAAFSGLSVGPSEGKEKEKEKEAVDMEPKEYTVVMIQLTRHPSRTNLLRAHPAPLNTL